VGTYGVKNDPALCIILPKNGEENANAKIKTFQDKVPGIKNRNQDKP
jgi:hypothetical protein